jgi:hypothetical protein
MVPKLICILQLRKRGREKKKGCIARERVLQENPYLSKMTPTRLTLVKEESEKVGGVVLGGDLRYIDHVQLVQYNFSLIRYDF